MNLIKAEVIVNGKLYTLQHPGNREWLKLKKTLFKVSDDSIDFEPLLDYFFAHCCIPETGSNLTLDSVDLKELEEVWSIIAPKFLRGDLVAGYIYPDDGRTGVQTSTTTN